MATSELVEIRLMDAARRAYEQGRLERALLRGGVAALLAMPGILVCQRSPFAIVCLAGLALVVAGGHLRGEAYAEGSRAGALAGILPCLLPATLGAMNPQVCMLMMSARGLWICALGGAAGGLILGWSSREARGAAFWAPAIAAFGLAASIGCLPAGAVGFAGLAAGLVAGGTPVLVARRLTS